MAYHFNTPDEQREMLEAIGAASVDELFTQVPEALRLSRPLDIPPALGELELTQTLAGLAAKNKDATQMACFLGGGSYDHFIPAAVDMLASRGEFYTSYTPYQPEVSQGNLQATFEYQTLICQLTGMDVSNASLYDGGSAVAEAALMCLSVTKRYGRVVVSDTLHPEYRAILSTYFANMETELVTVATREGGLAPDALAPHLTDDTACVVLQYPNFFGGLEDVRELADLAHDRGAKVVVSFDPIAMGLLTRPADLGADVAVAEGQSLGSPMAYGGPYLGIMACRESFVRRMPGRIAGETVDRRGRRCWVLTLQTREQHIRREKATSNICTNQGLFALRAAIYLSLLGPRGLRDTAELCLQKAHYAERTITEGGRFVPAFEMPHFKEFVVRDLEGNVTAALQACQEAGIFAGIPLGTWFPELADCLLIAVTEQRTKSQIDALAASLNHCSSGAIVHA